MSKITHLPEESLKSKNKIDYFSFFLAPLFVLIMLEIMHLSHFTGYPQFFGNPFFLLKWLISYVFLLLFQSILLVIIPNLVAVHTLQMVIFFCLGFVTEVLLKITGNPLLPSDLFLIGTVGEIAGFVEIPILVQCVVSLMFAIFSVIFFKRRGKKIKSQMTRVQKVCFALAAVLLFSGFSYGLCFNRFVIDKILPKMKINITAFNPQSDLFANGTILTFFPRLEELIVEKPEGYTEEKISAIKSKGTMPLPDKIVKPNVIAIQNEALWDITLLPNTTFSSDPMANIRRIGAEKNAKLGTMISPVFGGGTCMPEFEFLTGLSVNFVPANVCPYIQAVNRPTPSLVSSFKSNGYETYALHTYKKNFYARHKAYPLLGFETFLGDEDLKNPEIKGWYISDMEVTRQLIKAYESKKKDRIFEFAVTMQNHGGYTFRRYSEYEITAKNDQLNETDSIVVSDFTQGVYDADIAFAALVDYFRNVDEPTVIVMYGDHLPLLGDGGTTYLNSGYINCASEDFQAKDYAELFKTPYIVWANYDIDLESLADPISPANLGLSVYNMAGLKNVPWYYSAINSFYKEYPVYSAYTIENKSHITIASTEETLHNMAVEYKYIQYDLLHGKKYAEQ